MRPYPALACHSIILVLVLALAHVPISDLDIQAMDHLPVNSPLLTYVIDEITQNTTWDLDGSPYQVNSSLNIHEGAELVILQGVNVLMGKDVELVVNGSLFVGGDTERTRIESITGNLAGSWGGIVSGNGSRCIFNGVDISGTNISLKCFGAREVVVRNSTMEDTNSTLLLDHGSIVRVYNSTVDLMNVTIIDARSTLRPFSYISGVVVDHLGDPRSNIRFEAYDIKGILRISYIVNDTGEIPLMDLEGQTFTRSGRNISAGYYTISLSDDPFTHFINSTYSHNGTGTVSIDFSYTWAPELSVMPSTMVIFEDALAYQYTQVLDRNGVGNVEVRTSSPSVWYNWSMERLELLYANETVEEETVFIILDDGYDIREYSFEVSITPMNDPFTVVYSREFLGPIEDIPYELELILEDEDTPIGNIEVTTDDPRNITYDKGNTTLILSYGDGTEPEFTINVTVTDGRSIDVKEFSVYFQSVQFPPRFINDPPDLILDEDSILLHDLGPLILDPDQGDHVSLTASVDSYDVFSVRIEDHVMVIEPYKDMFGTRHVLLVITDQTGLLDQAYINITVSPVDDRPILSYPDAADLGFGSYIFNVTYFDIDGDMPDRMWLKIRDIEVEMNLVPGDDLDPVGGLRYTTNTDLMTGSNSITFMARQGEFEIDLQIPDITVPEFEDVHGLSGYGGSLNVTLWTVGEGGPPKLVQNDFPAEPIGDLVPIGCQFSLDLEGLTAKRAFVRIWVFEIRPDIMPISISLMVRLGGNWTRIGSGSFETSTGVFSIQIEGNILGSTYEIFSELDNEYDSDGDGVKNLLDAFPLDHTEWNDTDRDGTGDNQDRDDDDDGFTDEIEITAGSDPLSSLSYPTDIDNDLILDYLDPDDDGDGMTDEWEENFGLDPLDPQDASDDPDNDGKTNLEEYLSGTDPLVNGNDGIRSNEIPWWLVLVVVAFLAILVIIGIYLVVKARKHEEPFEIDEDEERDWEIQGELDPRDAVDCPHCNEIYPLWFESCPNCKEENPYDEE